MKKIIIAAIFTLIGFAQTQAQVTFRPGLRAGANFSHFTDGSDYYYYYNGSNDNNSADFKSKADFYIGFYGALKLTRYYTLQPEITYSRQGSKFETSYREEIYNENSGTVTYRNVTNSGQLDVSYLSIAVINKFTFTEKFNLHIGPTLDFVVDKGGSLLRSDNYYYDGDPTDVDLAFVAGVGFNFTKNFGIEARVKKGIVPVIDTYNDSHTNVVFSAGATYTFDLK